MDETFWHERWVEGRLGFHIGHPHPALDRHWQGFIDHGTIGTVLVPLCGKSLDLLWLRDHGHAVLGVEFIRRAIDDFVQENQLEATTEATPYGSLTIAGSLRLACGDFYQLAPAELCLADAVYDRAAFVAVDPTRRAAYARKLKELTRPAARLFLVNFVHDGPGGPPFSVPEPELRDVLGSCFELEQREEEDILDDEPRFRERGATFFREQIWFGRRKDASASQ
ncbi:MAG TPA: hypothetical protein VF989_02005 [Polyangiaceae bacterium]